MKKWGVLVGLIVSLWATNASAFCGFYVGGAGAELFNDASQVVLMRDGTKTILSMQNRYDGPVDDFALVIPVPEVLMEANVKTLEDELFAKLDRLTAPRLVEYEAMDPCAQDFYENNAVFDAGTNATNNSGVVVEAEFTVGEYDIVVLSAEESTSLETWLVDNDYNIPTGASDYYQPYIDGGMYFFVARVNPDEVTFDEDGRALLSPLRFDYDSETFQLPIRLGMINSAGQQDIIIHTLGRSQRYEAANYDNVTIPTNKEVTADTKSSFGEFYKTLFARTVVDNPGAVVTEYAWQASNCDPCPGPVVNGGDLLTLGADLLEEGAAEDQSWVITRLHARFAKDEVGEDIVFQKADPIVGGRQFVVGEDGELEQGAQPSEINNFQGRYIIYHPWTGEVDCEDPYISWGEPQASGSAQGPTSTGEDLGTDGEYALDTKLVDDVPELGIEGQGQREAGMNPSEGPGSGEPGTDGDGVKGELKGGCAGCSTGGGGAPLLGFILVFGLGLVSRRRRA